MALSGNEMRRRKSVSRLFATQALFQMEARGQSASHVIDEFEEHRFGADEGDHRYHEGDSALFTQIIKGVVAQQSKIDVLTDQTLLKTWPLARIDPTLRAIFRAAMAEYIMLKTPSKVLITEYLNVVAAFFPQGQEIKLVNGVLDAMLRTFDEKAFARD